MDSSADPLEYLLRTVRDAVSPLEYGISCAAKDLESHWLHSRKKVKESRFPGRFNDQVMKGAFQETIVMPAVASDERKKGLLSGKISMKSIIGALLPNPLARNREARPKVKSDGSCSNCLSFAVAWSIMVSNFVQRLPNSFKCVKKCFQKSCSQVDGEVFSNPFHFEVKRKELCLPQECDLPSGLLIYFAFESLIHNLEIFDWDKSTNPVSIPAVAIIDHMKTISDIVKMRRVSVKDFLSNMGFAKVGGVSEILVGTAISADDEKKNHAADCGKEEAVCKEELEPNPAQKLASNLLNIPLSNVERLRSTLSTVSLTELIEFIPHLWKSSPEYPSKKKLFSVQDFFRYTEAEGSIYFLYFRQ